MIKFNLQLFAVQSSDTMPAEMKTYYDKELVDMADAELVHRQFCKKKSIPANGGNKIEWRKFSNFEKALTPLTEGVTPTGHNLTVTPIVAELEQYGDYTTVTDVLEMEAIDDTILEITDKHASNMGKTADTLTRNVMQTGTQVIYADGTTRYGLDASNKITGTLVSKSATQLKKMNAPKIDGYYVGIIHPSVAYDLMQDSEWIDVQKYAEPENRLKGELGKLHGVRFVETTEAKIFKGEDLCDASANLTVKTAVSASDTVTVNETLEANALVGRYVLINDVKYKVSANTASAITLVDAITGATASVTASAGDAVYPGEGGKNGCAVYGTLFLGKDSTGTVDLENGGAEVIVKPVGSAGSSDPLDQRGSIGFKFSNADAILVDEYIVRLETGSTYSDTDEAN